MNNGPGGNMNEPGHSQSLSPGSLNASSRQYSDSWINSPAGDTPDLDQIDQFAHDMYRQYEIDIGANGHFKSQHALSESADTYDPNIVSNFLGGAAHPGTIANTPSITSQDHVTASDNDLYYLNHSSLSIPSSRMDSLFPTQPSFDANSVQYMDQQRDESRPFSQSRTPIANHYAPSGGYQNQPGQLQQDQLLSAQHSGPVQESHLKRKFSLNPQTAPLTPPLSKAKASKHLQRPTRPKTIRQNSSPVVGNNKVKKSFPLHYNSESTVSSSHDSSSLRQSYFEFENVSDYLKSHKPNRSMDADGQGFYEPVSHNELQDLSSIQTDDTIEDPSSGYATSATFGPVTAKMTPRPRGRPKKSKYPGFFIKLDNINRSGPVNLGANPNSSVESLFQAKNLNVNLVSSKQFGAIPSFPDLDDETNPDLRILEPDLGNYDGGSELQRFASVNSNMTPSMKPPGTSQNGYFELDNSSNNFLSPHINYNEQNYNNFNKGFSDYLVDAKQPETRQGDAQRVVSFGDEVESHPDLNGYNFDVNPSKIPETDNRDSQKETYKSDLAKHSMGPEEWEERAYVGVSPESGSSPDMPHMERTASVQSTNSSKDGGETGEKKKKKKRNTKGAICSICNKHISRDLTRHLRIHNEVGRFQCVYPKGMCNHKTQHFNRPYDYKKHLLHIHFKFDDPKGKLSHTLTDKLPLAGTCIACGNRFIAKDWLDLHVLTSDSNTRCPHVV